MARLKLFIPVIIFFTLGLFLLRGLYLDPSELPSALIDKQMPKFSLATVSDLERIVTEKDLVGQVALVNVWATWCVSCRVEHPNLLRISQQEGIPIYGIDYKDDTNEARRWLEKYDNPYKFNIADLKGTLGMDLGVYGAPETFLIDKQGVIRYKYVGVIDMQVWNDTLKPIVEKLR